MQQCALSHEIGEWESFWRQWLHTSGVIWPARTSTADHRHRRHVTHIVQQRRRQDAHTRQKQTHCKVLQLEHAPTWRAIVSAVIQGASGLSLSPSECIAHHSSIETCNQLLLWLDSTSQCKLAAKAATSEDVLLRSWRYVARTNPEPAPRDIHTFGPCHSGRCEIDQDGFGCFVFCINIRLRMSF